MSKKPKAYVSWSSGKDAAWALYKARETGEFEIAGILTTVTGTFSRVSMHGVREELLDLQAEALGLPCHKVSIPWPCPNGTYEARMEEAVSALTAQGVSHMIFGDLFLEDVRAYREEKLKGTGLTPVFPLWGAETAALAREMIEGGLEAHLVCVDPRQAPKEFAGRRFDAALLEALPANVDPCGERGEFHTVVTAGPMFTKPIACRPGEVVEREGFIYADFLPG